MGIASVLREAGAMIKTTSHTTLEAHRRQLDLVRRSILAGVQTREQIAQYVSRRARLVG